jgi:hypothetical protein
MFAYDQPRNGQTFNWAGMWMFGSVMIVMITIAFIVLFRDGKKRSDELTAFENSATADSHK